MNKPQAFSAIISFVDNPDKNYTARVVYISGTGALCQFEVDSGDERSAELTRRTSEVMGKINLEEFTVGDTFTLINSKFMFSLCALGWDQDDLPKNEISSDEALDMANEILQKFSVSGQAPN